MFIEKTNTANAKLNHFNDKLSFTNKNRLILTDLEHFYVFYCNLLMQLQKYNLL